MVAPALRVENLGKRYRLPQGGGRRPKMHYRTLRESLVDLAAAPFRKRPARGRVGGSSLRRGTSNSKSSRARWWASSGGTGPARARS